MLLINKFDRRRRPTSSVTAVFAPVGRQRNPPSVAFTFNNDHLGFVGSLRSRVMETGRSLPETPRVKICSSRYVTQNGRVFRQTRVVWFSPRRPSLFFFAQSPTWFVQTFFRGDYRKKYDKNGDSPCISKHVSTVRQTSETTGTFTWVIQIDIISGFVTSPPLLHRVSKTSSELVHSRRSYDERGRCKFQRTPHITDKNL